LESFQQRQQQSGQQQSGQQQSGQQQSLIASAGTSGSALSPAVIPIDTDLSASFDFPRTRVESLISQSDPILLERSSSSVDSSALTRIEIDKMDRTSDKANENTEDSMIVKIQQQPFSAYQGREFSDEEISSVLYEMDPWIEVQSFETYEEVVLNAAEDMANGRILAWFQGRSEFGQRALGSRSIVADPRQKRNRRLINEKIKQREWYRPLAPSVLAEHAGDWFIELENNHNTSPYMSFTATVVPDKVSAVPAICHVDDSARLQTVTALDAPLFYDLIQAFFKLTGIPMVLNTSLNRKGKPIVETPLQAIETLLGCEGEIQYLYMGLHRISLKPIPYEKISGYSSSVQIVNPSEDEGNMIVRAVPMYISEVTSSISTYSAQDNKILRIRIQDGALKTDNDPLLPLVTSSSSGGDDQWRELPSELSLEVLQLLQPQKSSSDADGEYDTSDECDILVSDLISILRSMRNVSTMNEEHDNNPVDEDEEQLLSWSELREALAWLHKHALISITDPSDISFKQLLDSTEVVDLRSLG